MNQYKNIFQYKIILLYLPVLLTTLLFGCSENGGIIDDERKAAAVYVDLMIVLEKNTGNYELAQKEKTRIFKKYNVTEEQFKNTMEYYSQKSGRWELFFNNVNARLEELRRQKSV